MTDNSTMSISNIGKNIKRFRKIRRLTQSEVAALANIPQDRIQSIEESKEDNAPSLDNLMRICMALEIPIDCLVKDCGVKLFEDYAHLRAFSVYQRLDNSKKARISELLYDTFSIISEENLTS